MHPSGGRLRGAAVPPKVTSPSRTFLNIRRKRGEWGALPPEELYIKMVGYLYDRILNKRFSAFHTPTMEEQMDYPVCHAVGAFGRDGIHC